MYARTQAKQEVVGALKKYLDIDLSIDDIETPPDASFGDFAYPVFHAAQKMEKKPFELASELAAKIGPTQYIKKIEAKGPYVNFTLNMDSFGNSVLEEVMQLKSKYGYQSVGEGKKIVIDYAQPNTHKEFHVGHVRNATFGQSLVNLMRVNGYNVIPAAYIGDIGAHVAKALWGIEKFHKDEKFLKKERAKKLGEIYAEATSAVDGNDEFKKEIAEVQSKLEGGDKKWNALWKITRQWSLDQFKDIFKELDIKPEAWYFESEVEGVGKELVKKMLTDGIAKKSDGAIIVDLQEDDLGVFLVLKSDGSSLYSTKDLALALRKDKDYGADRQLFVVDVRQSLYFKQLFATLKRLGFTKQLAHISYDMVNLPDGTMSSRAGNIVTYEQLRDLMIDKLYQETKKRHEDWQEKKIRKVAHDVAIASITFIMLRQDAQSIITFDMDEALKFDGFTAPYLLYSVARIESIRAKAKSKAKLNAKLLTHKLEQKMIRKMSEYPDVVERAGASYQSFLLAIWCFDMAQMFNEYYHEVRILDDEDKERMQARLALLDAVEKTMQNALKILNIQTLKEM
jgi:arginyl-tRNA synthetase